MKMLLIPVILVIVYILFIDVVSQMSFVEQSLQYYAHGGTSEVVGIGQAVSVSTRRPYLFGLFYLPTYSEAFGYIGGWHDAFFAFVVILTIALLLLEFKHRKEINVSKIKPKREIKMAKSMNLSYVKFFVYGLVISLVGFLSIEIALGILMMYLAYKFSKFNEKVKK